MSRSAVVSVLIDQFPGVFRPREVSTLTNRKSVINIDNLALRAVRMVEVFNMIIETTQFRDTKKHNIYIYIYI